MRRSKILIIAFLAALLTLVPLSASATAPSEAPHTATDIATVTADDPPAAQPYKWPGMCRHAWMWVTQSGNVYLEPGLNSRIIGSVAAGPHTCRSLELGGRYSLCGGTGANGWILIAFQSRYPYQGWIPSTCTKDPDPLPPH